MKIALIILITLSTIYLYGQDEKPVIKHELDIGFSGVKLFDDSNLKYNNFYRPFFDVQGRLKGSEVLTYIPRFSLNYTRTINDQALSIGYFYFSDNFIGSKELTIKQLYAIDVSYHWRNLVSSKILTLRPKGGLQTMIIRCEKYDPEINFTGLCGSPRNPELSLSLGFSTRLFVYKKLYLANNFDFVHTLAYGNSFLHHYVGVGWQF